MLKVGKQTWLLIASALVLLGFLAAWGLPGKNKPTQTNLTEEELALLVKPSVVRIIHQIKGKAYVPKFEIDIAKLTLTTLPVSEGENIDETLSGSGFVVDSDGYILTNAHVVSREAAIESLIVDRLAPLADMMEKSGSVSPEARYQFLENAYNRLKADSRFDLVSQIYVLNPSEPQEFLNSLLKTSFPVNVVKVEEGFLENQRDLALIKIDQTNLPGLKLANAQNTRVGNTVYTFGFPTTAEFNRRSPLEATLTKGLISATKFSALKDFRVLQTDTKVSQGSSGSPLFDKNGQVVGIITFQTGQIDFGKGDNFAFALPADLISEFLQKAGVTPASGLFAEHLQKGFQAFKQKDCFLAIKELDLATQTNPEFVPPLTFRPFSDQCHNLIANGESRHNLFLKIINGWQDASLNLRASLLLGMIGLLLLASWGRIFYRRLRRDEKHLDILEKDLEAVMEAREEKLDWLEKNGTPLPLPDEETHSQTRHQLNIAHPHLEAFAKEAKAIGLSQKQIEDELKKAGWPEHEIARVF
jgi:S1-C subfamily serine protease